MGYGRAIKKLKLKINKTVILPILLYGCETWSLILREEHRLRVFESVEEDKGKGKKVKLLLCVFKLSSTP
jgi:hypothetical protein